MLTLAGVRHRRNHFRENVLGMKTAASGCLRRVKFKLTRYRELLEVEKSQRLALKKKVDAPSLDGPKKERIIPNLVWNGA